MSAWPYTTPSGHTYVEPTTCAEIQERVNDWCQAHFESWDEAERPPQPTWDMIGICLHEILRLRTLASLAQETIKATDEKLSQIAALIAST